MYKRILLAADGSENSLRAAKEAAKIAKLSADCIVEIVHVADFSKAKSEVLHAKSQEYLDLSRKKQLVPTEREFADAGVRYQTLILRGDPGSAIIDYASENNAEMIIIGSRGLNNLQEVIMGSVSQKVVKKAGVPVLVVK